MIICYYIYILLILHNFFHQYIDATFWSSKEHKKKKNNDVVPSTIELTYPINISVLYNGESINGVSLSLSKYDCDLLLDLSEVVCPLVNYQIPCKIYSSWGTRVASCNELSQDDVLYIMEEDSLFMWPTYSRGHVTSIKHIAMPTKEPILIETLSIHPNVFKLSNFFTNEESEYLINFLNDNQINENELESYQSKVYKNEYVKRNSEVVYDENSPISQSIKRRAFELLGIFPYDETYAEGLYLIKYNQSNAYAPHYDYIDEYVRANVNHYYNSFAGGTNRFATILLYLTDVDDGGETIFSEVIINSESNESLRSEVDKYLIDNDISDIFDSNSWEKELLIECRRKLTYKPKKLEALLFYNQQSNGEIDLSSKHGGCPVLKGTKVIANLWIWNGPKEGNMKYNHKTEEYEIQHIRSVSASFECTKDVKGASLYWEDNLWEEMVAGRPIKVNTFPGHKWTVYVNGDRIITWTINGAKLSQRFVVTFQDLPRYNSKNIVKDDSL